MTVMAVARVRGPEVQVAVDGQADPAPASNEVGRLLNAVSPSL